MPELSTPAPADTQRYFGLDAARAFALLLGVFFHAAESYVPYIPAAEWFVKDSDPSVALGTFFYLSHIFRMPVFFLIAGFFARLLLLRIGLAHFLRHRAQRILLPMVSAWCLLFPVVVGLWIWGGDATGARPLPPETRDLPIALLVAGFFYELRFVGNDFSTMHLWFLYYLALLYILALGAVTLVRHTPAPKLADRLFQSAVSSFPGLLLLIVPMAALLCLAPNLFGIHTPNKSLWPDAVVLASYGLCFAVGWLLHRGRELLDTLATRWWKNLLAGAIFVVPLLVVVDLAATGGLSGVQGRVVWAILYATVLWCWVLGTVGLCERFAGRSSAKVRYVADSSYWVYLVHIPLVALLQIVTESWQLPWLIEYLFILAVLLPLLFASYHLVVRSTPVGTLLNGRRYPFWMVRSAR